MSTTFDFVFLPVMSGKTSVPLYAPVGIFTPPPRKAFHRWCVSGLKSTTRVSVVMSPMPRPVWLARADGPAASGDGMPQLASTNGTPMLKLIRGENW
jgi:hypothetical protein